MSVSQTFYALIKALADKNIKIWLEDESLKFKAPKGALNAELKNQMLEHKPALISFLKEQTQSQQSIAPRPDLAVLPISNAQQRLWFIEQYSEPSEKGVYNIPIAISLRGDLNIEALSFAINTLISRHEILQTYFENKNGLPIQKKVSKAECVIPTTDLSTLSDHEKEYQSALCIEDNIASIFELNQWPLFKLDLVKLSEQSFIFLATMHHIIADGWSMNILVKEIAQYYQQFISQGPKDFPAHFLQYADYAHWQTQYLNESRSDVLIAFWKNYLSNAAILELPLDKKRLPNAKKSGQHKHFLLDESLQKKLNTYASAQGLTLFMLLSAAFNILLSRFSNQHDISIGIPVANRSRPEWESMIGFFVNTLVLRSDLSGDPKLSDFLKQIQENTLAIYSHQELPFDRVVETLVEQRDSNLSPLFQVMFSLQNTPGTQSIALEGLEISVLDNSVSHSRYDMTWSLSEQKQGIEIDLEYNCELFHENTMDLYLHYFSYLLNDLITQPDQAISAYQLQSPELTLQQVQSFNPSPSEYPRDATIIELFDSCVKKYAQATAISYQEEKISYEALAQRVNSIADYLLTQQVQAGDRIMIALQRSIAMTEAILAVLKVGACYVPLDPDYPNERKKYIQHDSQSKIILSLKSQAQHLNIFDQSESQIIFLDDIKNNASNSIETIKHQSTDTLAACIFYTSGSTGEPKGVIVPHRAIVRLVCHTDFAPYSEQQVVAHISNVCFDAASMEIWGALLNGGRLHIIDQDTLLSAHRFAEELAQHNISIMFLAMGLFRVYASENPRMFSGLNTLLIGGEAVDLIAAKKVLESGAPPARLVNGYGPTENTTFSATYVIKEINEHTISMPLGKAIANSAVYIADKQGKLLPAGLVGELICAGDGLALGYLNKDSLSQQKFMTGFIQALPQERVYLSGDLARYAADGNIILSGRADEQIKLRGYRIEPGEIEHVLASLPGVSDCCVLVKENGQANRFLVAYIVKERAQETNSHAFIAKLKEQAQLKLPSYMQPTFFVELDKLPLNSNGKVDKRVLPDPDWHQLSDNEYVVPHNDLEEKLSDIWTDLLSINSPSIRANFFDLGGHSLLATQLASRIYEAFSVELKVKEIFEHATIEAIAKVLQTKNSLSFASTSKNIKALKRNTKEKNVFKLSKAQQRLWFIHQMDKESSAYGMPMAVSIKGDLDIPRLEGSFKSLIKRHESLRTRFILINNEPMQCVEPADDFFTLAVSEILSEQALQLALSENQSHIFDLEKGPLFFARLLKKQEQDYLLLLNMHHIISDGWSMQILQNDLLGMYQHKGEDTLPPLEIQYADFSVWQSEYLNEQKNTELLTYWQQELIGVAEVLHLPSDRPRPAQQNFEGAVVYYDLDINLQKRALEFCKAQKITSFVLGLSAYALLLSKYSQQQDFCIGIPVLGREQKSLESLIGFFVNGVVIRSDLSERLSVEDFLLKMKEKSLAAFAHQDLSADVLIEALGIKPNPKHQPLAQVAFSHQKTQINQQKNAISENIAGISFELLASENYSAKYELILSLADDGNKLTLACEYATALFDQSSIEKLLEHFEFLLTTMIDEPKAVLDDISWYKQQDIIQALNEKKLGNFIVEKAYPLSANQQAIYLDALINPETKQNSIANFMELKSDINSELWEQAFKQIQNQHEIFKSKIINLELLGEHRAYQAISNEAPLAFTYRDFSSQKISFETLPLFLEEEAYCTYAIERDELYHYSLFKLADNHYVAMLRAHHILFDGVSGKIFLDEIAKTYEALLNNKIPQFSQDNFSDFIQSQNKIIDQQDCLKFWKEKAKNVAALSFDALEQEENSSPIEIKHIQKQDVLSISLSSDIKKLCRQQKITPAIFFKSLYAALIYQYCRPESDFYLREYAHGRSKAFESSYGVYYQQTPFVLPIELFTQSEFDSNFFSGLFLHAASFQKQSRLWRDFSIQSQSTLFPSGKLGFMYNYTQFEAAVNFMGAQAKTLFLSPRAEQQVQLFVREHSEHFELLLLYGDSYFQDCQLLPRLTYLAQQLCKQHSHNFSLLLAQDKNILWTEKVAEKSIGKSADKNLLSFLGQYLSAESSSANKTALNIANRVISYADLHKKSEALAHILIADFKVTPEQRIALYLPLNENYLIALLAIVKTGASYVPIQVDYPIERIKHIIANANIKIMISEQVFIEKIDTVNDCCLMDQLDWKVIQQSNNHALPLLKMNHKEQALYSIYTSGSTGVPKGAQVSVQSEANLLQWYAQALELNERDKSIIISAPGFDLTQKNFFAFLACGGSLVFPESDIFDPAIIRQTIEREDVTHINCAPSAFYALLEGGETAWQQLRSLRWVVLGGEPIRVSEMKAWYQSKYCHAQIMNSYGPTECTDVVCAYVLNEQDFLNNRKNIPLGSAIDHTKLYVLNDMQQQLPISLVGEIAIGGACLGLGYIEQPKLNQEQFIEITVETELGLQEEQGLQKEKVYLSGDLGRVNAQGELEYIGRKDFQIKLRGQRLELSEIENALRNINEVRDALVILEQEKLVAYLLKANIEINLTSVAKALEKVLPAYMLPSLFIPLEHWPLNTNGKIDRKALPKADFSLSAQREKVLPRNDIEQALLDIWSEVLATDDISVHDSFFELGGHSLLATKAVSRLKEHFKIEFPLRALFDLHTIADVAAYIKTLLWAIESKEKAASSEEQGNRDEGFL